MNWSNVLKLTVALIAAVALAAAGLYFIVNSAPTPTRSLTPTTGPPLLEAQARFVVVVPSPAIDVHYAPLFIALDLGYFKTRNLVIDILHAASEAEAIEFVSSGKADIGFARPESVIKARSEGLMVKALEQIYRENPYGIFLSREKRIGPFTDLAGMRVGVIKGSTEYIQFKSLLTKFHVGNVVEVPVDTDLVRMFAEDRADAVLGWTTDKPYFYEAGIGSQFVAFSELGLDFPGMALFAADRAFNNEEALGRFVNSISKALKFMTQNPEEAAQILSKKGLVQESPSIILKRVLEAKQLVTAEYVPSGVAYGLLPLEKYGELEDFLLESGFLQKSLSVEDFATTSSFIRKSCNVRA